MEIRKFNEMETNKMKCQNCNGANVSISVEDANGNTITFDEVNGALVENNREGFVGNTNDIINIISNNLDKYKFMGGCGDCEDVVDLEYNGLTEAKDIFEYLY